jgi:hypothetical protein
LANLICLVRCLHSYGYNLFTLVASEPAGPLPLGCGEPRTSQVCSELTNTICCDKNTICQHERDLVSTWLVFLSSETVVQGIGTVIASTTSKEVRQLNLSR